ncbi:MAG: PAS domain-containing protein [Boseongicola sp.]|nr:PAS domain-containing protein [Boseongicola sp.]
MTYSDNDGDDGGRIVEMTAFRGPNVRPILAQVEAHWEDLRGRRLVPSRSEIDPQALDGALAHVFILERISTGLARFRIAGSHLSELMNTEVRGLPASAIFEPASREQLSDAMQSIFDDPAIVRLELNAPKGFGRAKMTGDMMLLPLRSDLGEISRALGVLVMSGNIGRAPRRLEITGQSRRGLVGYSGEDVTQLRGKSETDDQYRLTRKPIAPSNPTRPHPIIDEGIPHLRLVSDNTREIT